MRAIIGYESMFGATRQVAEAIAEGMRPAAEVRVAPVGQVTVDQLEAIDLLVVGAPTHAHGLPRPASRRDAVAKAAAEGSELVLEPTADDPGVREWVGEVTLPATPVAAFDTRVDMPAWLSGRASKSTIKRLREVGGRPVDSPRSFLVGKDQVLEPGALEEARTWGAELAAKLAVGRPAGPTA